MLVLSRQRDQTIMIGGSIEITVTSIDFLGGRVTLSVNVPPGTPTQEKPHYALDDTLMIGDDIKITIVDIRGCKVRLGFDAPPHIPVHRKEVYEAILRENQAAAQAKGEPVHPVESLAQRKKSTDPPRSEQ